MYKRDEKGKKRKEEKSRVGYSIVGGGGGYNTPARREGAEHVSILNKYLITFGGYVQL
jgi:hypothetical protein